MNSVLQPMRWRQVQRIGWRIGRWIGCGATIAALFACNARSLVAPRTEPVVVVTKRFQQSVNRDLDILFMVDNSVSMDTLQKKLTAQLPTFMKVLKDLPTGQPNLHVAVISSSMGAGTYANVPGCGPNSEGNMDGKFQHKASCTALPATEHFLSSIADPANPGKFINNFTGDIADVFGCIALLGAEDGCGFEHQFASTMYALQKASRPDDLDNANFLRKDAYLAIVMVTNEDDCSTPVDASSELFDPRVETLADPSGLGGRQSYRCNEFGHLCDPGATPPPHGVSGLPVTLTGCTSSEGKSPPLDPKRQLIRVQDFVEFLKSLKDDPNKILVAALAGPPGPYTVQANTEKPQALSTGGFEIQPMVAHSCTQRADNGDTEFADPGIRINNWLAAFDGVFAPICAPTFAPAMTKIADAIGTRLRDKCINGSVMAATDNTPNCTVALRTYDAADKPVDKSVPFCAGTAPNITNVPCWRMATDAVACPGNSQRLDICYDATCTQAAPMHKADALVSCAIAPEVP